MTIFVSGYNFMDLLKDKGFAPQTDVTSNRVMSLFKGLVGALPLKVERLTAQYDFMDLMRDRGFIPEPTPVPVNDNIWASVDFASLANRVAGKLDWHIEIPEEHHDFMDLMHDKGFVPMPSNDNDLTVRVA